MHASVCTNGLQAMRSRLAYSYHSTIHIAMQRVGLTPSPSTGILGGSAASHLWLPAAAQHTAYRGTFSSSAASLPAPAIARPSVRRHLQANEVSSACDVSSCLGVGSRCMSALLSAFASSKCQWIQSSTCRPLLPRTLIRLLSQQHQSPCRAAPNASCGDDR